ncbi:MAG: hypothetical protein ACRDK4_07680 [Solirubrobacteraceae bacterium]
MRLRLLTVVGAFALALAVPSAALAHHGRGHHRHHNAKAHHARSRFEHIGATGVSGPTTTPSDPTPPPTGTTPENAGKVLSYEKEVLTITLNDGSTVSGKVSTDTKIECVKAAPTTAPPPPTSGEPTDQSPGDDSGPGDDQSRGDMSQGDGNQSEEPGEVSSDQQDGEDGAPAEPAAAEPPCDTSALVKEAVVRSAELRIGPSGDEFENIVLVR